MSYLKFSDHSVVGQATRRFDVHSVMGNNFLGEIRWYNAWRRYAFFPEGHTVFDTDCLKEITQYVDGLMALRAWRAK